MANPIANSRSPNTGRSGYAPEVHYSNRAKVCGDPSVGAQPTAPPKAEAALSPGAELLLQRYGSRQTPEAPPSAHSNAERTHGRQVASYAEHSTRLDSGTWFAGAAVGKGDVPGGAVEALSVSAQIGAQNEVQLGTARLTMGDRTNFLQLRTPEVEAHAGAFNADGSEGVNDGASVSLVAAETTVGAGGNSLTAGVNVGWGGEISAGQRDADGDGRDEVCVRAGLSLQAVPVGLTVGACVEPEGIYDGLKALVGAGK